MSSSIRVTAPFNNVIFGSIELPTSKSLCNRALILAAGEDRLKLFGISEAADSQALIAALACKDSLINVGHGGTTLRFALAHFATQAGEQFLTGTPRLMERPIQTLVGALCDLGADIEHLGDRIRVGKPLRPLGGSISMAADVSSQFVTALLLIGWRLPLGLEIEFETKVTSRPYIDMTIGLMRHVGLEVVEFIQGLKVARQEMTHFEYRVEPDWSAASYAMSLASLADESSISVAHLKSDSLQGDAALLNWCSLFGLTYEEHSEGITFIKTKKAASHCELDLSDQPDLAQTIAVICAGLGMTCRLTGLHTLPIKETDRLAALQNELAACGIQSLITSDSVELTNAFELKKSAKIKTYHDHRMAMAFAPLALKLDSMIIEDPLVVNKSFPTFWAVLEQLGFRCDLLHK